MKLKKNEKNLKKVLTSLCYYDRIYLVVREKAKTKRTDDEK